MGNLKTGESNSEDVIIPDKEGVVEESKRNYELCRANVQKREDRYGTRPGVTRHAAVRGEQRNGTQANCTDDVIKKNDGHQVKARQGSASRFTHLRRNHRRLAICTPRVLRGRTGTLHSRAGAAAMRQTVNLTRGGSRTDKEYRQYSVISKL